MKTSRCAGAVMLMLAWSGVSVTWGQDALGQLEQGLDVPLVAPEVPQAESGNGYLGMTVDLAKPEANALFVTSVEEGGPAQRAGFQVNDVIAAINGVLIQSADDMERAARKPAGTKLVFDVRRGEATRQIEVTLGVRPGAKPPSAPVAELPPPVRPKAKKTVVKERPRPNLGISVKDVDDALRGLYSLTVEAGAVITQVRPGTPAARAGLPIGGVIVSINDKRISSANDIVEVIAAYRPGDEIAITYFEGERAWHKRLRLAPVDPSASAAPKPARPRSLTTDPSDRPLRLGQRRSGDRPVLDALERVIESALSPPAAPQGEDATVEMPPPPPAPGKVEDAGNQDVPIDPPPPPPPRPGEGPKSSVEPDTTVPPADADEELARLRKQMETLKQELEQIQRRIDELEQRQRG